MSNSAHQVFRYHRLLVCIALLIAASTALSQEHLIREGEEEAGPRLALFPFAFYNDMMGASVALAAVTSNWPQPQSSLFLTTFVSNLGTSYFYAKASDLRPIPDGRLYASSRLTIGYFDAMDLFTDGHPDYENQEAGSNSSREANHLVGRGLDQEAWLRLHYLFPIGQGRMEKERRIVLRDGLVLQGSRDTWPPLPWRTGYTMMGVRPFYRSQDMNMSFLGDRTSTTIGSDFFLEYDATDFSDNPGRGSRMYVGVTRDWGSGASTTSWTQATASAAAFLPMGKGTFTTQRTLALGIWTSHCLSWESYDLVQGEPMYHRPPAYTGASLGGLDRMRGYASARFNDRSALVYSAEYRHSLKWNPLLDLGLLQKLGMRIDWLQLVYGLEAGRVAPAYELDELHRDLKFNALLGLRLLVNHLVIRIDLGLGSEGTAIQMISDQPY